MPVNLERLRTDLERQRDALELELAESNTSSTDGMGYSTHPADDGTVAFDQAAELAMRQNTERLLYQVTQALERMQEGTYGTCHDCGKSIDYARLKAIPYAHYCMDCANKHQDQ
jgi:RNA polymerase-binding protein DksA